MQNGLVDLLVSFLFVFFLVWWHPLDASRHIDERGRYSQVPILDRKEAEASRAVFVSFGVLLKLAGHGLIWLDDMTLHMHSNGPAVGDRGSQLQSIQTPVYVAEKQCAAKNVHVAFLSADSPLHKAKELHDQFRVRLSKKCKQSRESCLTVAH